MSGNVADKAVAFKNEVTGSTTRKIVCKASNHDLAGPKKKHVDYLINMTNDPNCSMATLADYIFERMKNTSWVVVFKNLIMTHNLMTLGNEKFLQCLATRANSILLDSFTDRTDTMATEMSVFVRRYSKYLSCMCTSYKTLALDLCRLPRGEETPLRSQDPIKLLKTTSVIQEQLDLMMNMEISSNDLTNGVINTAFLMLYKDLVKLYAVYNDALINVLEKFFEMSKPQCKEAMAAYKKFITRQEPVQRFLQLAEDVGMDKQSHLNLRQVPEDLLPALESHLSEMDSIKKATNAQPSPQIKLASEKLAKLHTSSSSATASQDDKTSASATSASVAMPTASSDILEAQRKRFEELKKQTKSPSTTTTDGPSKSKEDSLFDQMATTSASKSSPAPERKSGSAMDDLAELQGFASSSSTSTVPPTNSLAASNNPFQSDTFTSTSSAWSSGYQEVDLFSEIRGKPQPDFDSVFGASSSSSTVKSAAHGTPSRPLMGGDLLTPEAVGPHATVKQTEGQGPGGSILTRDVDSSLVRAAETLSLDFGDKTGMVKKTEHQWKPSAPSVRTGGEHFMKMQIQPKTLQPHTTQTGQPAGGQPANWSGASGGMYAGHFPAQPMMMQQPAGAGMYGQMPQPAVPYAVGQQRPQTDLFGNAQPTLF